MLLGCDYCSFIGGVHDYRCPLAILDRLSQGDMTCCVCDEPINNGEEYCINNRCDVAHYDCLCSIDFKKLFMWADIEILCNEEE